MSEQVTLLKADDIRRLIRAELGADKEPLKQAVLAEVNRIVQKHVGGLDVQAVITTTVNKIMSNYRNPQVLEGMVRAELLKEIDRTLRGKMKIVINVET